MTNIATRNSEPVAVIYTRVSSRTQSKKGDGLSSQETRCREFAQYKGYRVVRVFRDDGISGGLSERPAMGEMLAWLKANRRRAPIVLIDDISRFARGIEAHWKLRSALSAVGGRLESPSIEFGDDSDSQLIENMLASVSQHQRQKNAEQVVNRMKARLTNGYFCFSVPTGYAYTSVPGQGRVLIQDEPSASLLREALEGFAIGRFQTQAEVRRFLEPHPIFTRDSNGEIHPQRIANLLTNEIYAGYYTHKPWGVGLTKGRHEPLISWETFQRIQTRLSEASHASARADNSEDFPLRGFVTCASCGNPMTGYWAKGRNRRYAYYECFHKPCDQYRKTIRKAELEDAFDALLRSLRPSAPIIATAAAMFRTLWDERRDRAESLRESQRKALTAMDAKAARLTERLIETDSTAVIRAYEAKLEAIDTERALVRESLQERRGMPDFNTGFRTAMQFLSNPHKLWVSGDQRAQKTVLKLVFAAPLPYARNKGFRTAKTTMPFKALARICDANEGMAEGMGFEPTIRVIPV